MKSLKIALLFSLLSLRGFSQWHEPIGALTTEFHQQGKNSKFTVGLDLRFPINKHFTFNYKASIGKEFGTNNMYLNTTAGSYFGTVLIAHSQASKLTFSLGMVSYLLPSGISYFIDSTRNYSITFSPLCVDYWHKKRDFFEKTRASGNVLFQMRFYFKESDISFVAPSFGVSYLYNEKNTKEKYMINVGLAFGLGGQTHRSNTEYLNILFGK